MHLLYVGLTNFRNYRSLEARLQPGTTILWGENASGKSSFLEAVYFLATTRSPRAGAERELIHWDAPVELGIPPFARIVGRVQREDGPQAIEVVIQRTRDHEGRIGNRCQKRFRVNRREVRAREAAGRLRVVLFEPEDLRLISGSPARRRRYLDESLMQADPLYWQALRRYQRVLLQRNRLLRQWQETGRPAESREQLAFWNRELVQQGSTLIVARRRLLDNINNRLTRLHGRLAGRSEPLTLTYRPSVPCAPEEGVEGVAFAYRKALTETFRQEIGRGTSLLGPHRDDLGFMLGPVDLAIYGSRGQQRTATIALKLAQVEWLQERSGEEPVILLDDVLSELDPQRQAYLQGWLLEGRYQVFITATSLQVFRPIILEQAAVYQVEGDRWSPGRPTSPPREP